MKSYIKCSVCGYIAEEGKTKDVCPACGAPIDNFSSYVYGIDEKRLKRLNMHLHPILVHFPQSLAIFSFVFLVLIFLTSGQIQAELILIEKIVSIALPFTIIAAMAAGVFDAKTRLKNSVSRIRKQKIQLGSFFLVFSCIAAILINYEVFSTLGMAAILLLSFLGVLFGAILGNKGSSLLGVMIQDVSSEQAAA
ncbi:MAG: rubredoxin-like domain-containing protein [Clostridiaceae bacterium]